MPESKVIERGRAAMSKRAKRSPDDPHYAAFNFADGQVYRVEKVPNPYRNLVYVPLRDDFAVVGHDAAQHAATLTEAIALRNRMEGRADVQGDPS